MKSNIAHCWFKTFRKATSGLAAVEFALIAPIMMLLFFGSVELSTALRAKANVTNVAGAAADLVAQETNMTNAEMDNVMAAMDSILFPYSADDLQIVISSVVDNGAGGGRVAWSDARHASPRAVNSVISSLPAGLILSGSGQSVIMAEIKFAYSSESTEFVKLPLTMKQTFYARPRRSLTVTRSAS